MIGDAIKVQVEGDQILNARHDGIGYTYMPQSRNCANTNASVG
jgi:hypothetical protein